MYVGFGVYPTVTVSVGEYMESYVVGHDVICDDNIYLEYQSTLVACRTIVKGRYLTIRGVQDTDVDTPVKQRLKLCEIEILGLGKSL